MRFMREYVLICKCGKLCNEKNYCGHCKIENVKSKTNFVVKIPLAQQIKYLLNKYSDQIVSYSNRKKNENISDIDNGLVFKMVSDEHPDCMILSFTINSDGAPAYKSSKTSFWPVHMYANFLPPNLRFKAENILLYLLYVGENKPDLTELFNPLAQEIEFLQKNPMQFLHDGEVHKCMVLVMLSAFDLPARAMASGQKTYAGHKACVYCLHPGIKVRDHKKNVYVRYIKTDQEPEQRNHADVVSAISKFHANSSQKRSNSPYGLIDIPAMFLFRKFDLKNGYTIDYMHCVALNVVKLLLDFWLGNHRLCKKIEIY